MKGLLTTPHLLCVILVAGSMISGFCISPASALVGGLDSFGYIGEYSIEIYDGALAGVYDLAVAGPAVVSRGDSYYDPDDPMKFIIDTEIVSMNLSGSHQTLGDYSVSVRSDSLSTGKIKGQHDGTEDAGGNPNPDFPAESFFDVFFEIEFPDQELTIKNNDALHMDTVIERIPSYGNTYRYNGPGIPLYSPQMGPDAIGRVVSAEQTPVPEPSMIALFAGGLAMVVVVHTRRRRRR